MFEKLSKDRLNLIMSHNFMIYVLGKNMIKQSKKEREKEGEGEEGRGSGRGMKVEKKSRNNCMLKGQNMRLQKVKVDIKRVSF